MERLGCFFLTARNFDDLAARVAAAEELGFEIAGFPHIAGRDALTTLAAIGPRTSRIKLATGIVPIYTRTPVTMAQEAGTIAEATGNRFVLGIGTGHAALVESWHGQTFESPLAAMRDYVTIVRSLFRDASVQHDGERFRAAFGFLGFRPPESIPIMIGALGPKMLRLAGELADGAILWLSSPQHIREVVVPNLRAGAAAGSRSAHELSIFPCLFAAPGPDRASARDAIRRQLVPYLTLPFYRDMLIASGFGDDLEGFADRLGDGDLPGALSALSDRMIDSIAATGSPEQIAETLYAFVEAGATMPGVGVVGGYEGYAGPIESLRRIRHAHTLAS
ncbi:MAG TPA: LLM class flavin-dependent oxidoreductase [Actinomycetota bacterium]|nr:LLM class flavin-dependent oxidoreductase [Actinomycetota bacterium]